MTTASIRGILAAVVLLAVLPTGAAAAIPTTATGSTTYDLGDGHALGNASTGERYADGGVVSAAPNALDVRLTLAASHEDAGLEGWTHTDFDKHYLRVQYNESIRRTLRFEVSSTLFTPHPADDVERVRGGVTADFSPVDNGTATEVVVTVDGETDAVFPISRAASTVFEVRRTGSGYLENATGWELPSFGGASSDWERLPASAWANGSTPRLDAGGEHLMLQYDVDESPTETSWVAVPQCSNAVDHEPVCRFSTRNTTEVHVVARTNDTPPVRYRHGRDLSAEAAAAANELWEFPQTLVEGVLDGVGGLFG